MANVANACFFPDWPEAGIEDVATLALTCPRIVGSIFGATLLEAAGELLSFDGMAARLTALFFEVRAQLYPEATRDQVPHAFFRWVGRIVRGALEEALGASGTPGYTPSPELLDAAEALLAGFMPHLAVEFEGATSAVCFLVQTAKECPAARPRKRAARGLPPWARELLTHAQTKRLRREQAEEAGAGAGAAAEGACPASPPAKRRKAEAYPATPERPHFWVQ